MLKRSLNVIVISLFLSSVLCFYYSASPYNGIYYYRALFTLADAYIYFLNPRVYGMLILPFIIIIYTNLIKYDDEVNALLRLGSVKKLVRIRIKKAVLFSLPASAFVMFVVTLANSLQTATLINWDSGSSIYLLKTEGYNSVSFVSVFIMGLITLILRNILVCLWVIFFDLRVNNSIITFIILFFVVALEMFQSRIPLFCSFITIDYSMWDSIAVKAGYCLYIVLTLVIYGILMQKYMKTKEWL